MNNFLFYVLILLAVVTGVIIVKKVTSCLFKLLVAVVVIALVAWLYSMGREQMRFESIAFCTSLL